ncbi:MAG: glycosyltransferase family 4 protein [Solirubrobacteraceae bacterium]
MSAALGTFVLGAAATYVLMPVAIRVAHATGFLDRPTGYKRHGGATPYLGGTAVLGGFVLAALTLSGAAGRFSALLACAAGLWLLGTLDDLIAVPPRWRLLAELGAAVILFDNELGWSIFASDSANLVMTAVWVVGLVNAFNLMDNLDGAAGSVAVASGAGIAAFAFADGDSGLAAVALALAGACIAFLHFNLARPARIFLGDGGSMPVGLLLGTLALAATNRHHLHEAGLLAGALLVGLPILDTALVSFSRRRRGISLLQGGRDHLTHRLLRGLGSPQRVALVLVAAQVALGGLAVAANSLGYGAVIVAGFTAAALGIAAIAALDGPRWGPALTPSVGPKRPQTDAA